MEDGFDFIFNLIFIIIIICFITILGTAIKNFIEYLSNKTKDKVSVKATVISKRMNVSYAYNEMNMSNNYTTYYIGFEFINGEREEFTVKGRIYNLLIEGDKGNLTIQGTRFIDFKRE